MLIGREAELAGLGQILDAARLGTSGALVVRGEAGIGKTALLEHAATSATTSGCCGQPASSRRPSSRTRRCTSSCARSRTGSTVLADPQARALRGALGLADATEADRFLVGVGTLTLLADAAEEQPLLALLDDAAWFDRRRSTRSGSSARRLQAEAIVLLFAVRDEPGRTFALPGVEQLRVQRLPDDDARALIGDGLDGDAP